MDSKKTIVELYHNSHSLVRHHLDSYNHFIDVDMKKIVKAMGVINLSELNWQMEFTSVEVLKPSMSDDARSKVDVNPHQCRLRNMTYAADIVANIRYTSQDGNKVIEKHNQIIGRMPVMVRSRNCALYDLSDDERVKRGECRYDPGGYFITRGTERVFLLQEQMAKNRMIIEKKRIIKRGGKRRPFAEKVEDKDIVCHVVSSTVENKSKTTVFKNNGFWYAENTIFTESIPLCILFAGLNMPSHYDIFHCIGMENELHNDLLSSVAEQNENGIFSQQQALKWLISRIKVSFSRSSALILTPKTSEEAERSLNSVKEELLHRVFHHVPAKIDDLTPRARYLGLMVRKVLLTEHKRILVDDRDFYGTKRIDLVGYYLALAFDDKFQNMIMNLKREIEKTLKAKKTTPLEPCNLIKESTITDGMYLHIYTGNWSLRKYGMDRSKVTEVLNRLSYIATLGNLCKVTSQFEKVRKVAGVRSIHLSQYGLVCVADTPEGEACGLIKNLAFMVEITVEQPELPLAKIIKSGEYFNSHLDKFQHCTDQCLVMLNAVAIGWTLSPFLLSRRLRELRRCGKIHHHVSIYFQEDDRTLNISSDGGKMVRPYIICENGYSCLTNEVLQGIIDGRFDWNYLIMNGIVEYLDAREAYSDCLLAAIEEDLTLKHTHLDIDPATILGPVASLIPFPHHNQSPRNTYQCAMGKQALGVIATNQNIRFDGTQHLLINPQRPLTLSTVADLVHYKDMPAGQNAIVAITCFGGHDVEDALIINKASLERGIFRTLTFKSVVDVLKDNDVVGKAESSSYASNSEIELDGTPSISTFVRNGNILINKLTTAEKQSISTAIKEETGPRPFPTRFHGMDGAQVTKVMLSREENGYIVIKVSTSQMRTPEVGDKFSSRHGQKGVIGRVVPTEEMPYSEDGIVPDIIMNPHGFPSRMTVGKLIELLANKAAVLDGQFRNSSAFVEAGHKSKDDDYPKVLGKYGFSFTGKDVLTNGTTGRVMESDIYMGPIFYQRLKHMVQDKVHARSTGKNVVLTRQPTVGRANDGGLRIGEMERDCLIAYGATQIIKERMMLSSDPYKTWVCEKCGMLATSHTWCQMCRSSQHIACVVMPYASKLLIQELSVMHIKVQLTLSDHDSM